MKYSHQDFRACLWQFADENRTQSIGKPVVVDMENDRPLYLGRSGCRNGCRSGFSRDQSHRG